MTTHPYPDGFLWGSATSAHQVEGNNLASDLWALENAEGSPLPERSGDACDSYHRWSEDLDLVRDLGLNTYRFGVEWSRIEPVQGQFSRAALAHYRRMIDGCLDRGLTPMVTLHHFTSPLWFHQAGSWTAPGATECFRTYVRAVLPILDGVEWVCTINEPNMVAMVSAARSRGAAEAVAGALPAPEQPLVDALVAAHRAAREELSAGPGVSSGWTVANQNFQPVPGEEDAAARAWALPREDQFIDAAAGDDFIGVQAYTRLLIGRSGPVEPPEGTRRTQMGWEFFPGALEGAIRHTAARIDTPIVVTENGIATGDDDERTEYLSGALAGLERTLADGIDVRGYLHWSLLDNYEWGSWRPTFGLASVDRTTFARTVKPSGHRFAEAVRARSAGRGGPR